MIELSRSIQRVASPRAPAEIPKAPCNPNLEIDKKTLTTKTFKGIPNKFMMMDLFESGTYLLRRVPIEGKYIPTHASKAKKEAINAARLMEDEETVRAAPDIAKVATLNMAAVKASVGTAIFANCPKRVDPNKQLAIKQENTVP